MSLAWGLEFIWAEQGIHTLCSVQALLGYLAIRLTEPDSLFVYKDSTHLSHPLRVIHLRQVLAEAGIDTAYYSGHSSE